MKNLRETRSPKKTKMERQEKGKESKAQNERLGEESAGGKK